MTPLLQAENIGKSFGSLNLFSDISLVINRQDKIALIAPNGAGKTTLLNILAGNDTTDSGVLTVMRGLRIGYLAQDPELDNNLPVIRQVIPATGEIAAAIREYEEAVESGDRHLIDKLTSRMDALQAWDQETRARQILTRLRITDFSKPVSQLSGGQRKRVALARVLMEEPELLLLDEPTNHLDVEMTEWLEGFLGKPGLTLVVVTHDRYFLDRVCNQIIELDNKIIYKYSGNYSCYLEKRSQRLENMQAAAERARNLLQKEMEWMRRMPQARTTKSKSRIAAFHDLKEKAGGTRAAGKIKIQQATQRLGNKILELENISKSYGDECVIRDFSYTFSRFEKVGIIGRNGSGKSTFLNIVTGSLKPDSGSAAAGETVNFGYFRQEGITFGDDQKVIDVVRDISEVVTMKDGSAISPSQLLTRFLFPPARQHDYIGKLSGGERRRLYLVTILMRNPNFLVLDEPTNDIDIYTLNVLEDYLSEAGICLLAVSHDRFFIDKISDHIFVFEGNGIIRDFPGNYTQYRSWLTDKASEAADLEEPSSGRKVSRPEPSEQPETGKQTSILKPEKIKKLTFNEKRELESLEGSIEFLESEKSKIEEALSGGNLTSEELMKISKRHGDVTAELDIKINRWLELSEKC